jgi:hypothetical protein
VKTDLFALGSAIYFIMMGHEVFPDLDSNKDEEEIERRFRSGQFPVDPQVCSGITSKCWAQEYGSAQEVVDDIAVIQKNVASVEKVDVLTSERCLGRNFHVFGPEIYGVITESRMKWRRGPTCRRGGL